MSQGYDYYQQSYTEKRQIADKSKKPRSLLADSRYQSLDVMNREDGNSSILNSIEASTIS